MLNCKQATELMSQRLDRDLSIPQKLSLRLHLMMCVGCRNFGRQMDFLRQVSRKFPLREA
ncbi:MAG: zf-HC2 domain-containing protein [Ferrovum sp.]|jgi:predicted anti-sigma-YlaC factor YlaD|uniref:zf-HC2 domain-containing protein n=1 Tax=Ferrovum sp. TaxID=2609467 RepID=UPI00344CDA8B|nr:zf-HC2 domain-containing protein [Ferrovum sp.]